MSHRTNVLVGLEAILTLYKQLDYLMAAKLEIYNKAKFSLSHSLNGSIKK